LCDRPPSTKGDSRGKTLAEWSRIEKSKVRREEELVGDSSLNIHIPKLTVRNRGRARDRSLIGGCTCNRSATGSVELRNELD
jgi:hypothetical protein